MECNVGTLDRTMRILIGVALVMLGVFNNSWIGLIGILALASGIVGWCSLYTVLGVSTCNKAE